MESQHDLETYIQTIVALVKMSRPSILPGGMAAYSLGAAMGYAARGTFDWQRAGIGLIITVVANLTAHFADEYADVDTDSLARRTWFSGGSGVLPKGIVPPVWALYAALTFAILAAGLTLGFVAAGTLTPHVIWIVGLGLLGGWFYSMPPLALERRGLGALDNAVIGAFLMPLMGYTVQTGRPTLLAVIALVPIFLIVMVGLLGVHWADRQADATVGKRSLVVRAGARTRRLHRGFTALAYLSALALAGSVLPLQVCVAILLTLPAAIWVTATFPQKQAAIPSSTLMVAVILAASAGWIAAG